MLDLSQSLNPVAPDPVPGPESPPRRAASLPRPGRGHRGAGRAMGVERAALLLTNGGAEAIGLVGEEIGRTGESSPSSRCIRATGARCGARTRTTRAGAWPPRTTDAEVWDEAFYALATGRGPAGTTTPSWWVRSPSSSPVPGLRVGYVLVPAPAVAVSPAVGAASPCGRSTGWPCPPCPSSSPSSTWRLVGSGRATLRGELVAVLRAPRARAPAVRRQLGARRGAGICGRAWHRQGIVVTGLHDLRDAGDGAHRRAPTAQGSSDWTKHWRRSSL